MDECAAVVRVCEIIEINSSAIVCCVVEVRLIIVVIIILNYNLTRGIIPQRVALIIIVGSVR